MLLLFVEKGLYQNATAPVKGEKVSLQIPRAGLNDRVICFSSWLFYRDKPAILFP